MRAAYITEHGPSDAIRVGSLPVPVPGPGEVLVRVDAVAANHVDTFVRSGAYATEMTFPFVIGRDLAGTVVHQTESFPAGARVWTNSMGHNGRQGAFAEYVAVPQDRLYTLPNGVGPIAAVSVLHTAGTAHIGLYREARIRPGETIVVVGAGGGVGSAVCQLASAAGVRVLAVDRAENAEWCREHCGAAAVIDRGSPGIAGQIATLAPSGVDVYWNNSGRHDFDEVLPIMARGGRIVLMAGMGSRAELPVGAVYTKDISLHGFVISNASAADLRAAAETVNRELRSGRLRGRIRAELPLSEAAKAHQLLESGTNDKPGRVVLVP
ncbi:oxidoreductase [Kibdelosporangium phytohabitans]|uniref:Oxidoreductase n=2 Tax=Kibdelosporangium phytohabitans TaxID=860235 RepID=A0A0N9IHA8_9PSEU|nr:oxidoreductase [Kibdelosporangium phytohabitans]